MFERPAVQGETAPEDIVDNVRELCRLDPTYVPFLWNREPN